MTKPIEVNGEYTNAKIYAKTIWEGCIDQVRDLCNNPSMKGQTIRVMPDTHVGKGCVIGLTATIDKENPKIIPNIVGVDIGCGMYVSEYLDLDITEKDFDKLQDIINKRIPSGFDVRETQEFNDVLDEESNIENLICKEYVNIDRAYKSIGTLGGGNHFIEVNKDSENDGNKYLVIHTGSRYLGKQICEHYQKIAFKIHSKTKLVKGKQLKDIIEDLKAQGRQVEIEQAIKDYYNADSDLGSVQKNLEYLEGQDALDYLHDMHIAQAFAKKNREVIARIINEGMGWNAIKTYHTVHNYIGKDYIIRKGAVSTDTDDPIIIPMNMRDGSLICKAKKDVNDRNNSAPHGAGRIMTRIKARKELDVEEYKETMEGIYSKCICEGTIDESPMVYKSIDEIKEMLAETDSPVEIMKVIKPLFNFKAGADEYCG